MGFFKQIQRSKSIVPIAIFILISVITSLAFFSVEALSNKSVNSIFDAVWWSIVTMSTTGYGDIIPSSWLGRVIAIVAIISGILATALFTGTVATVYLNQISRNRMGLMSYKKMKGHVVICGWKHDMHELLRSVVKKENIMVNKLIVVAEPQQEAVDRVYEIEELANFQFVRGPFHDKDILLKANIRGASKALVLADQTDRRTDFEVDSRTVMTVISLKTLNKNIHVSAQLLEQNFEIYLQRAKCNEILYSKAINTELLSLVLHEDGMSNVISALVGTGDYKSGFHIESIKPTFIDKSFEELQQYYYKHAPDSMLLGVLENTGKQHEITEQAIRQAQMTADFPKMLDNLRNVQHITPNKPVLIPNPQYIIKQYSSAILLRRVS